MATKANKIHEISRRLLDPQRPHRRVSPEEAEVFLMQYDPVLPLPPRKTLSHSWSVFQTTNLLTSPTLLESTSLVFGFGLDLFLTRVAPSGKFDVLGEEFNKFQLVATIIGLAVAILFTAPIVRNKQLKAQWY